MGDMKRLLRDIGYFGVFALMVLGIIGAMYHAVGEDGWIDKFLGEVIARGVSVAIGAVVGIGIVVWLGRRVLHATRTNALFNDFLMYGFMALGMWFLGSLLLRGSF
jgi:uncharacterized membrane protein YeaQ/YmgE (transglycosylase-associated protein family)